MTDPTARYPLPDDPGSDPPATAPTMTAVDGPPPPAPPTAVATDTPPPPPPAAWTPPTSHEGRWPALIFGLILLAVGLWFFLEVTLGVDLPTIRWGSLWPLILIVVGVLILYGARLGRKR